MMTRELLTIAEVAHYLRLAPRTIANALSRKRRNLPCGPLGDLPFIKIGRRLLLSGDELERWLEKSARPANEPSEVAR